MIIRADNINPRDAEFVEYHTLGTRQPVSGIVVDAYTHNGWTQLLIQPSPYSNRCEWHALATHRLVRVS